MTKISDNLCVVLPVFNEEKNIEACIYGALGLLRGYVDELRVIAVDDGSTDGTAEILCRIKDKEPELEVISNCLNRGYGYAIRRGIAYLKDGWVFVMDSDGQYDIKDFLRFWDNRERYDFILGYRVKRRDGIYRNILGGLGNLMSLSILGSGINDINCGFKLFKAEDLRDMRLISNGGAISFEIIFNLLKADKKFIQLPATHYRRKAGRQTGGSPKVVLNIIKEGINIVCSK